MPLFTGLQGLAPLALALEYARRGVAVFPVSLADKRPLTKTGFHAATRDIEQIERWWSTWPTAAVAAPAGPNNGFEVVDFDRKHGDPFSLLEELEQMADCVLRGPRVVTQSQGLHIYVRATGRIRNSASKVLRGVDTRGEGGYVLLPGNPGYSLMLDGELEPPPESLVALFARAQGPSLSVLPGGLSALPYQRTAAEQIQEVTTPGRWHDSMLRITWAWVMRGFSRAEIADMAPFFRLDGFSEAQTVAEILKMADAAYVKQTRDPRGETFDAGSIRPQPFDPAKLAALTPRKWIYGGLCLERFCSVIGAPGGTGKTAYAMAIGLAVALGRGFLNQKVHQTAPVWIYNLEDPLDEIMRRLAALMKLHGVKPKELVDRLYINSGRDQELVLAQKGPNGNVVLTPNVVNELAARIRESGVKLFIVDPFVKSHRLEENRNEQIDAAVTAWSKVADLAECSVLLVHHFRKGGQSGDQDAFRGASALIDASRAAVSLAPMSSSDAEFFGIEEHDARRFVRIDNAKLNLTPRPEEAQWLELVSVHIDTGDNVQAVRPWYKPGPFDGLSIDDCNAILDRIELGYEDGTPWASDKRAGARWAGKAILAYCAARNIDRTEAQASSIIRDWVENGVLTTITYRDNNNNKKIGLEVDPKRRPGREDL
jgi:hypothetical protein